jgi:hypothetical protein
MKTLHWVAALATLAITATMFASTASAQATRTWVSGVGDDANPCSRTAPCKTFAGAISKTAPAGEINCIDPGGFGALTITKSITVDCVAVEAGVLVSGTNGFVVAAGANDVVVIRGLDFEGLGPTANSLNGIKIITAGTVQIENCVINGFDSTNGTDGNGVLVNSNSVVHVDIENDTIRNNQTGVSVVPQGVTNGVVIEHSVLDRNVVNALAVADANSVVLLNGDGLLGSPTAISNPGGGSVVSYGTNLIRNAGAPTQTLPLQ